MARVCIVARKPLEWNYRIQRQVTELADAGHEVTLISLSAPQDLEQSTNVRIITVDTYGPAGHVFAYLREQGAVRRKLIEKSINGTGAVLKRTDALTGVGGEYDYDMRGVIRRFQSEYGAPLISRSFVGDIPDRVFWMDFDVVQVHDSYAISAGIEIAERTDARLVADIVELATERTGDALKSESVISSIVVKKWFKRVYSKFHDSIAVGDGVASWTAEELDIDKPTIIRNCRPAALRDIEPPYDIRAETPMPDDALLGVFVGAIRETIGVDSLLRALPRLDREVYVSLLGPGHDSDYAEHLRETAEETGVSEKLNFIDPVNAREVPATIMSADFGFHGLDDSALNNIYALPNKFFEYVTAQIPLAVPNYPDMGGLVKEYDMGVSFAEVAPEEIASSLENLFENYDRYKENVVEASRELTWANEAEKYRTLIEEQAAESTEKRPAYEWIDGDRGTVGSGQIQ